MFDDGRTTTCCCFTERSAAAAAAAEYIVIVFEFCFALKLQSEIPVTVNGDCLSFVDHASLKSRLSAKPLPYLPGGFARTLQQRRQFISRVKGHDLQLWSEFVDAPAKAIANTECTPFSIGILLHIVAATHNPATGHVP